MLFRQTFTRSQPLVFHYASSSSCCSSSSSLIHRLLPTLPATSSNPITHFLATTTTTTVSKLSTMSDRDQNSALRALVISGPSGSGKSTLLNKLFAEFPGMFSFSISQYHFVTRDDFIALKNADGFLETAEFSGNCYGTSKKSVTDISNSGRLCVLDVEVNGVKNIKNAKLNPTPRYIFIRPPSIEELKKRLEGRGTETEDSLAKRLNSCQEAFDYADVPGSYDHIIINNDLEVAYEHLKGILVADIHKLQAEKLKKGE